MGEAHMLSERSVNTKVMRFQYREIMFRVLTRIKRSFAIRGVLGTIRACWDTASEYWLPSRKRAAAMVRERELKFDATYGLDTTEIVLPHQTEVRGGNWMFGQRYQGVDPGRFVQLMSELSIDHGQFTFIDFGSGKGRAIVLAMNFPFKKIIGIEYSEQLNVAARQNVLRYPDNAKRCKEIEIICGDATDLPIPDGPLVLYLNNPFGRPVMERVIHNVSMSFQVCPRRMVIIYFLPEHLDLWDKVPFLRKTRVSHLIAMYDTHKEQ
jgi:hypothetical protein